MPVMRVLPDQIAVRMSRPPPTPMTATSPLRMRYGKRRDVVLHPVERRRVAVPLGDHRARVAVDGGHGHGDLRLRRIGAGPHRNGGPSAGVRTITFECAFHAE